jgi:hypothetical protein
MTHRDLSVGMQGERTSAEVLFYSAPKCAGGPRSRAARALKVANFNSLSGFDHHDGTKLQRIGTSLRSPS